MRRYDQLPGRAEEARRRLADYDPTLLADALPRVGVPILVQWSSDSTYLPPVMARTIAALARRPSPVLVYPDTGHLLLTDAAEETARDVAGFLEG